MSHDTTPHHRRSSTIASRCNRFAVAAGLTAAAAASVIAASSGASAAPAAANRAPIGHLDSVTTGADQVTVSGWAADLDTPANSIDVIITFGAGSGMQPTAQIAHSSRPDVPKVYPTLSPNHGFSYSFQVNSGTYPICASAIDLTGLRSSIGCKTVTVPVNHYPIGHLDSVRSVGNNHIEIVGWAADSDTPNQAASVNLLLGGTSYATSYNVVSVMTTRPRPDVAKVFPNLGPNHGFDVTLAAKPGTYPVCALVFDTLLYRGNPHSIGCLTARV